MGVDEEGKVNQFFTKNIITIKVVKGDSS